ncbi:L-lactate dehydrogenase [Vagococcus bubulae]|uniref:L-lactate dehydrogenase n=1 Tax=Vagococcus bubulae TaxID=1977868 RepID=A0A429ZAZ0_9ENTE|nr:L-lactate dehydrogenase [Vagococcus bubulae]RST90850.1 L-lactate dehydrogenase [Vagococcus bubulae]
MSKVGIIGLGHVGSDIAYTLCTKGQVDELVLIDKNKEKVMAEYLELTDSMMMTEVKTTILLHEYRHLNDADIIVISVGSQSIDNEDRVSELNDNKQAVKEIIPQVVSSGFKGIFLVITNPCDVITTLVHRESGFPAYRVIGTGTSLDTNRMKRIVGEKLGVSGQSINGYVLGEHGESQFVAWSTVMVGTQKLLDVVSLSEDELEEMKEATRLGGWEIHQRKSWTSYGIASTTSRLIQSILKDEKKIYPLSIYQEKDNIHIGYPAVLGKRGIVKALSLDLTKKEDLLFRQSVEQVTQYLEQ